MKSIILLSCVLAAGSATVLYVPDQSAEYSQENYQPGQDAPNFSSYADQLQAFVRRNVEHQPETRPIRVVKSKSEFSKHGYSYGFETENGIKVYQTGTPKGTRGSYSYPGPDGQVYTVTYTADEGGYRAQGGHLPTPPPTPLHVLNALQQNARDEASGVGDDGLYRPYLHKAPKKQSYQPMKQNIVSLEQYQQKYNIEEIPYHQPQNVEVHHVGATVPSLETEEYHKL